MPYSSETGVRIYYETYGEGPALVLIHANPFDHNLWLYQIARFSTWFRVIAVDIRGYGRSEKVTTSYTLDDMVQDVLGVCGQETVTEAIVGGVSVGSGIALALGLSHPAFVRALVLVGGASSRPESYDARIAGYETSDLPSYQRGHIEECVAPSFARSALGRYLIESFVERAPRLSGAAIGQVFRARGAADLTPRLPSMRIPTLVVNGEMDMSLEAGKITASKIPEAWHRVLPGTGHACNIEDPAGFDSLVITFLRHHGMMPDL